MEAVPGPPHGMVLVEVAAGSVTDAIRAASSGADRLELCADLACGGLSPRKDDLKRVMRETGLPVVVLVRPRPGGFVYSPREIAESLRSSREFADLGVSGIAAGALDGHGRIDRRAVSAFVEASEGIPVVFHRAFDLVDDKAAALEELFGLGVSRILTSGGPSSAAEGAEAIAGLVRQARGRIEILPGGGIRADNASLLVERTGCRWIHGSFSGRGAGGAEPRFDPSEFAALLRSIGSDRRFRSFLTFGPNSPTGRRSRDRLPRFSVR